MKSLLLQPTEEVLERSSRQVIEQSYNASNDVLLLLDLLSHDPNDDGGATDASSSLPSSAGAAGQQEEEMLDASSPTLNQNSFGNDSFDTSTSVPAGTTEQPLADDESLISEETGEPITANNGKNNELTLPLSPQDEVNSTITGEQETSQGITTSSEGMIGTNANVQEAKNEDALPIIIPSSSNGTSTMSNQSLYLVNNPSSSIANSNSDSGGVSKSKALLIGSIAGGVLLVLLAFMLVFIALRRKEHKYNKEETLATQHNNIIYPHDNDEESNNENKMGNTSYDDDLHNCDESIMTCNNLPIVHHCIDDEQQQQQPNFHYSVSTDDSSNAFPETYLPRKQQQQQIRQTQWALKRTLTTESDMTPIASNVTHHHLQNRSATHHLAVQQTIEEGSEVDEEW